MQDERAANGALAAAADEKADWFRIVGQSPAPRRRETAVQTQAQAHTAADLAAVRAATAPGPARGHRLDGAAMSRTLIGFVLALLAVLSAPGILGSFW